MISNALRQRSQQLTLAFLDREYFNRLIKIAFPIALQQFIMSSLNMVGAIMIGQLGEVSVAAVGLANQIFFLENLLLFGIYSGATIFTAQFWGRKDIANIRRVVGLALALGLAASLFFLALAQFFTERVLGIYSKDAAVVALGSEYLHTFGWGYVFVAITFCYASVLRSVGDVKTPVIVSVGALCLNTLLSYGLILGNFGMPKLGVRGAAIATLSARIIECCVLLLFTYQRRSPAAASLREMLSVNLTFAGKVLRRVVPVAVNELLWSLGITAYSVVYARISTESIAAMNIVGTFDGLAIVIFVALGSACAVLVGHRIGANEERQAYRYAVRSMVLGIGGAILVGGLILTMSGYVLTFYKVSPLVIEYAKKMLIVLSLFLWIRVANLILFIGAFRAGGDIRFAFVLDAGTIWVVGVPLAFLGAFTLHLPVYWVYLLLMTDEVTKLTISAFRFFSKKWIHNLAETM